MTKRKRRRESSCFFLTLSLSRSQLLRKRCEKIKGREGQAFYRDESFLKKRSIHLKTKDDDMNTFRQRKKNQISFIFR